MAGIQTSIELNDQFSSVLYSIIGSVNLAVSSMYDMQESMNADIDTGSLEAARNEINQATAAIVQMNEALSSQVMPEVPSVSPEPVEISVTWNTDGLDVFTGTGIDRFEQEVQSTNSMLEQLSSTQDAIAKQAYSTNIFPPEAFQNLNSLAVRIDMVRERIQMIENNPVNIGTDAANAELEQLRSQLSRAIQEQNELNAAMQRMDVSAANTAYLNLSQTVGNTERYIRDNVDEQGRFNQEIRAGTQDANTLADTIKSAVAAYVSIQSVGKILNMSDELTQTTSRLDMMNSSFNEINGTANETSELVNMVYAAAQDARGSFGDMASVVARFGNNARDAFGSSEEVVAFADLVQKQMTIAGASTQEAANAELQLSQALGSGVLRGDELNSIFEQAPNLIQNIADYLDVPIGQIREMASEGELSADVVKAAIFAAADDINGKFEQMPMTWGQAWTKMQNAAVMTFQTVLQRINDAANSDVLAGLTDGVINAMGVIASIVLTTFDIVSSVGGFIADNWSIISPIVYGVIAALGAYLAIMAIVNTLTAISAAIDATKAAASAMAAGKTFLWTVNQYGLNAALAACPITWIIILIIALIAIIFAVCSAIAKTTGVANSGFGVIMGCIFTVGAFFKNLGLTVANIALGIGKAIVALASNMKTAFHNAICSIQSWFYNLLSTALSVIEGICAALNRLPFVEFDYSGISSAADAYAAKASEAAGNKRDYTSVSDAFSKGYNTFDTYQDGWASNAFNAGAAWGDGIADAVSNFSLSDLFGKVDIPNPDDYTSGFGDAIKNTGLGSNVSDISDNTSAIKDSVDISNEDLKYLRDIAEQDAINRFTTAEIKVDMVTNNNVSNDADLDGIVDGLTTKVLEAMETVKEGG